METLKENPKKVNFPMVVLDAEDIRESYRNNPGQFYDDVFKTLKVKGVMILPARVLNNRKAIIERIKKVIPRCHFSDERLLEERKFFQKHPSIEELLSREKKYMGIAKEREGRRG